MEKLELEFSDGRLTLSSEKYGIISAGTDFFRLFADDLEEREMLIRSSDQTPSKIIRTDDRLVITYDRLKTVGGNEYNIVYILTIKNSGGALRFSSVITNDSNVRLNEERLPYLEIAPGESETLYMPHGLGSRIDNPRRAISERYHTEYMSADEKFVYYSSKYPTPLSMSWFGLQTDSRFLCLGAHDELARICTLSAGTSPRHIDEN